MDAATKRKIDTRRKELLTMIEEQKPKLEAAKVIVAELKKIGEDTSELDNLLRAAAAFTAGITDTDTPRS